MPNIPDTPRGRARRHARWRRSLARAVAVVAAIHAVLLLALVVPSGPDRGPGEETLLVVPMAAPAEEPIRRRAIPPPNGPAEGPSGERPARPATPRPADRRPGVPVVVETPGAPEETTIPSTALDAEIAAPTLPLEAGPDGIRRRAPSEATIARMRAESLVNARLGELPGAKRRPRRAVGLAEGGGVTVAIPWQGFLPENREDATWREERCRGKDAGDNDKAGEARGRASQCS